MLLLALNRLVTGAGEINLVIYLDADLLRTDVELLSSQDSLFTPHVFDDHSHIHDVVVSEQRRVLRGQDTVM